MFSITRVVNIPVVRKASCIPQHLSSIRSLKTSNKKDDTSVVVGPAIEQSENTTCQPKKKRYFYDYGFGGETEEDERNRVHSSFFMYISLLIVGGGFFMAYRPGCNFRDWALREGHLELRRREKLGLPLVDPNYVDPSTIYLPTDEELGDTEIIV